MTIQIFCPKWYFITKLNEDEQAKIKQIFSNFIGTEKNFGQPPEWNCNVRSSIHQHGNNTGPWQEWIDVLRPYFNEFVDQVGTQQDIEIIIEEAWVNKYLPGESQEQHAHCSPTSNISMVYFYRVNEDDDCSFRFINNEHEYYKLSGLADTLKAPVEHYTTPEVETGTLLIFPSHYYHLVSPHRGTNERITFSGNFKIIPEGQPFQP